VRPKLKHLKNKSVDLYSEMLEVLGDEPAMGTKETTTGMMTEDYEPLPPASFNLDDFPDDGHVNSSYSSVGGTASAGGMGRGIIFGKYSSAGGTDKTKSGDKRSASSQPGDKRSASSQPCDNLEHLQKQRTRSIAATLGQEINGLHKEIGRVASAMDKRNEMDKSCWEECKKALEELQLDTFIRLDAINWLLMDIERRKVFLTLSFDDRKLWLRMNLNVQASNF
ncbi:hypothetical protein MKW92_005339, partial [Papaver armeniacum]